MPVSCSSNNSCVAEEHVYGSYARGHITLLLLCFFLSGGSCYANTMLSQQGEDWRSVRCMCGALCGRCQDYVTESGEATIVYRLVKYAIRPVSPSTEYVFHVTWVFWFLTDWRVHSRPSRIPLSAFIVEDMVELARVYATYRFVILDEEEERPRILVRASPFPCGFCASFSFTHPHFSPLQDVALQTEHASVLQG